MVSQAHGKWAKQPKQTSVSEERKEPKERHKKHIDPATHLHTHESHKNAKLEVIKYMCKGTNK